MNSLILSSQPRNSDPDLACTTLLDAEKCCANQVGHRDVCFVLGFRVEGPAQTLCGWVALEFGECASAGESRQRFSGTVG